MPFQLQNAPKLFRWQTVNGTPATTPEPLGDGWYVMLCPLCGGIHELPRDHHGVFTPGCVNTPQAYTHQRANWLKRFPQSSGCSAIYVLADGEAVDKPMEVVAKSHDETLPKRKQRKGAA